MRVQSFLRFAGPSTTPQTSSTQTASVNSSSVKPNDTFTKEDKVLLDRGRQFAEMNRHTTVPKDATRIIWHQPKL